MKRILIGFIFIVGVFYIADTSFGADVVVSWNTSDRATGYKLQHTSDLGTTWSAAIDVGDVLTATYTVPDDGLVLIRVSAYNATHETWRLDAGIWYNGLWKPLTAPAGVGVQ